MKGLIATSTLFAYITFGVLGFLFMVGMDHHTHTYNCPFMPGEKVVCNMNAVEHISTWTGMFTATIPDILIILAFSIVAIVCWSLFKLAAPPPKVDGIFIRRLAVSITRSQYQLAFSRGIIHSKNP